MADFAGQGEDLGAAALVGADPREPIGPVVDHRRHVGEGLDVVDHRRLAPQAALGRVRRADAGLAALAFDRMDQGRLLAADERPRAQANFQIETVARAEDVFAQQAPLVTLVDRPLDAFDRHRIFGADVDESLLGADGEAADDHPLDYVQRIALQHGAVHEGAGVAFVGIADEIADLVGGSGVDAGAKRLVPSSIFGRWDIRRRRGRGVSTS